MAALVLCVGSDWGGEARHGERGCSSTAVKIRRRARPPDAPSATWCVTTRSPPDERIHVQQGVEIGRTSDLFLTASVVEEREVTNVRVGGSTVLVAKGQTFPAVMHTLSTDFNQAQVTLYVHSVVFPFVTRWFHAQFRLLFPLFMTLRLAPYSCASIERNAAGVVPVFIHGFIPQSDR